MTLNFLFPQPLVICSVLLEHLSRGEWRKVEFLGFFSREISIIPVFSGIISFSKLSLCSREQEHVGPVRGNFQGISALFLSEMNCSAGCSLHELFPVRASGRMRCAFWSSAEVLYCPGAVFLQWQLSYLTSVLPSLLHQLCLSIPLLIQFHKAFCNLDFD